MSETLKAPASPKVKTNAALKKTSRTIEARSKVEGEDTGGWAIGIGIKGSFVVPK